MKKILLVDDDLTELLILKNIIKNINDISIDLSLADTPEKAIKLLKSESFDLIISDINMPNIGGFRLVEFSKKHFPNSKLILISASNKSIEKVNQLGNVKYFQKPLDLIEIKKFIVDCFEGNEIIPVEQIHLDIIDYLLFVNLSGKDSIISVNIPEIETEGKIYIKNKNVVDAYYSNLIGEKAFYKLISIKRGNVEILEYSEPSQETITNKNIENLLDEEYIKKIRNKNKLKVLFVDDQVIIQKIASKIFSKLDCDITIISSALEGMTYLQKDFYDLVITDINMPGLDGLSFLIWINENSPSTQVAIATGVGNKNNREMAKKYGSIRYIEKPIKEDSIRDLVFEMKGKKKTSNNIDYLQLADFIKVLGLYDEDKLITIKDSEDNNIGKINIVDGNITHAEYKGQEGTKALFSSIDLESASSKFVTEKNNNNLNQTSINKPLNSILKDLEEEDDSNKLSLVRKDTMTELINKVNVKNQIAKTKLKGNSSNNTNLIIFENGVALNIMLGITEKHQVVEIMKDFSQIKYDENDPSQILIYDDLDINIKFDENDVSEQISFNSNYKGCTSMGIKIGDTIEEAIKVYGKPNMSTLKGAVWDNIALFSRYGKTISSIRLRKPRIN